jgi:hypothetical protein
MSDEMKKAFEAEADKLSYDLDSTHTLGYQDSTTRKAWKLWQAVWNHRPVQAPVVPNIIDAIYDRATRALADPSDGDVMALTDICNLIEGYQLNVKQTARPVMGMLTVELFKLAESQTLSAVHGEHAAERYYPELIRRINALLPAYKPNAGMDHDSVIVQAMCTLRNVVTAKGPFQSACEKSIQALNTLLTMAQSEVKHG